MTSTSNNNIERGMELLNNVSNGNNYKKYSDIDIDRWMVINDLEFKKNTFGSGKRPELTLRYLDCSDDELSIFKYNLGTSYAKKPRKDELEKNVKMSNWTCLIKLIEVKHEKEMVIPIYQFGMMSDADIDKKDAKYIITGRKKIDESNDEEETQQVRMPKTTRKAVKRPAAEKKAAAGPSTSRDLTTTTTDDEWDNPIHPFSKKKRQPSRPKQAHRVVAAQQRKRKKVKNVIINQ